MQVTVEIPDVVAEQAKARGETAEEFVADLVRTATAVRPQPKAGKLTIAEMVERLAVHSDKIPQLPDEAFTRESFYRDHD